MPKIPSYPLAEAISNEDLLVMDDASAQYATKSLKLQLLKGFINTGQATTTYVDDKVVSGAAFNTNTGVLTLTRTDGINVTQNLDGRYALTSAVFSGNYNDLTNKPTIPAAYTNADVDAHLNTSTAGNNEVLSWTGSDYDWVAQSGGGGGGVTSIIAGDGISIDPAGGTGAVTITAGTAQASTWQIFYKKFTGSELKNAFNGNTTDKITLVSVPAGKVAVLGVEATTYLDFSTGTTDYATNGRSFAVYPDTFGFQYATSFSLTDLGAITSSYPFGIRFKQVSAVYSSPAPLGGDIILAPFSLPVNITAGDRNYILTFTYRIIDLS